jgi:hypothetical protein
MKRLRPRTPKQILLSHIHRFHGRQPAKSWTMKQMSDWHAEQHHRYRTSHWHEGVNLGPGDRPAGWRTGEDVIMRSGRVYP